MKVVDVKNLKINDVVKYLHHEEGKSFFIETGIVKSENLYEDGITVHDIGGQWKQYVGKFFIEEVIRDGNVIYKKEDE